MGDAWASPARVAQILADPATRGSFTVVCTPVHGSVLRNNIRRCHRTSFRVPPAAARAIHVLADRPPFGIPVPTLPVLFTRRCRRMRFRGHQVPAWCSPNPFGRAACRRDCQVSAHSLRNVGLPGQFGLRLGTPSRASRSSALSPWPGPLRVPASRPQLRSRQVSLAGHPPTSGHYLGARLAAHLPVGNGSALH